MASATHRAIDAVWRIESARLIAGLTRVVRDVSVAEDLAQDALVAALEQWPQSGIPDTPGAWLAATAKRRGIDALRRRVTLERKHELIGHELAILQQLDQPDLAAQVDDVQDDVLRLVFMTCHPVLSREARVALTLRLLGGLSTPEIARAFLVPEGTVAQHIVRAKRTLAQARVPFEVPGRGELADRLSAVLEVIYLVFNEGYAATAGEHWIRPALCEDALRLGRGLAGLQRAEERSGALGPYTLQAAIAACHARARSVEETDWPRIVALYDGLAALTGSPVVRAGGRNTLSAQRHPPCARSLLPSPPHAHEGPQGQARRQESQAGPRRERQGARGPRGRSERPGGRGRGPGVGRRREWPGNGRPSRRRGRRPPGRWSRVRRRAQWGRAQARCGARAGEHRRWGRRCGEEVAGVDVAVGRQLAGAEMEVDRAKAGPAGAPDGAQPGAGRHRLATPHRDGLQVQVGGDVPPAHHAHRASVVGDGPGEAHASAARRLHGRPHRCGHVDAAVLARCEAVGPDRELAHDLALDGPAPGTRRPRGDEQQQ